MRQCCGRRASDLREQISTGRGLVGLCIIWRKTLLAHPTPLTWSIIAPVHVGAGRLRRDVSAGGIQEPSPVVNRDGFLELIAGRIYMDAARAPEMFFEDFPFAYDLEEVGTRFPDASQTPPTVARSTLIARMKAGGRLGRVNAELQKLAADFDRRLNDELFPAFARWRVAEKTRDLAALSIESLIDLWRERETKVLDEFAPLSLLPSLISGMALGDLRAFLAIHFWQDDPDELSQLISAGGPPNRTVVADAELHEVGQGKRTLDQWILDHGHRAAGEFDLAARRWREQPDAANEMAMRLGSGDGPLERHRRHGEEVNRRIDALRGKLREPQRSRRTRSKDRSRSSICRIPRGRQGFSHARL